MNSAIPKTFKFIVHYIADVVPQSCPFSSYEDATEYADYLHGDNLTRRSQFNQLHPFYKEIRIESRTAA